MLSTDNVRRLNKLLEKELREADRFVNSDEEKMAALDRASKLMEMLSPHPTPQEVVEMLASALQEPTTIHVHQRISSPLVESLATLLANRR